MVKLPAKYYILYIICYRHQYLKLANKYKNQTIQHCDLCPFKFFACRPRCWEFLMPLLKLSKGYCSKHLSLAELLQDKNKLIKLLNE